MEPVGILLLNGAGSEWPLQLRVALQAGSSARFAVHEIVLGAEGSRCDHARSAALSIKPDIILFCASPELLADPQRLIASTLQSFNASTLFSRSQVALGNALNLPIVVATENVDEQTACQLLNSGVADVITSPFRAVDLLVRLWRLLGRAHTTQLMTAADESLARRLKEKLGLRHFVGNSPALLEVVQRIPAIARFDTTVLITGETGTGKEICARALHYLGSRAEKPFVAVNCGAIPIELVENELFGHEAGAYTGANAAFGGIIREAAEGTLFLDEIDSLPPMAQVKLLRLLQEGEFRPLGSKKAHRVSLRVIAACNSNIEEAIQSGRFRRDLYYRLNVIPMHLPPLRERQDDIPLLAKHFEARFASNMNLPSRPFAPAAMQRLMVYAWPGNVRELENVIERAVVLCERPVIGCDDLQLPMTVANTTEIASFQDAKAQIIADFERGYLSSVLEAHDGNVSQAARAAKKNRRAFWELLRKNNLTTGRRVTV